MPLFCLWGGSVCLFCNSTRKANQFKSPMEMTCLLDTVCILLTQGWLDLEYIFSIIKTSMIWGAPKCDLFELQWEMNNMKMIPCISITSCFCFEKGKYASWKSFAKSRTKKRKPTVIFPFSVWKIISAARDDFYDLWRHESRAEIITITQTSIFLVLCLHKSYSRHQEFDLTNKM